jgi:hypothetical protein
MGPSGYSLILSAENRSDLCPDAARKDGVGEFGGGATHRPAAAEQDELDNSEIGQIVTISELGQPGWDQALRNHRDAEACECRRAQAAQAAAGAGDAPGRPLRSSAASAISRVMLGGE